MRKGATNRTMKQKMHAQIRAKERLGFMPTHRELKALSTRVRAGVFVRRGVGLREIWNIEFRGSRTDVVFDPVRGHIVSFLPHPAASSQGEDQP